MIFWPFQPPLCRQTAVSVAWREPVVRHSTPPPTRFPVSASVHSGDLVVEQSHTIFKELVSFFWVHGEMKQSAGQTNHVNRKDIYNASNKDPS